MNIPHTELNLNDLRPGLITSIRKVARHVRSLSRTPTWREFIGPCLHRGTRNDMASTCESMFLAGKSSVYLVCRNLSHGHCDVKSMDLCTDKDPKGWGAEELSRILADLCWISHVLSDELNKR